LVADPRAPETIDFKMEDVRAVVKASMDASAHDERVVRVKSFIHGVEDGWHFPFALPGVAPQLPAYVILPPFRGSMEFPGRLLDNRGTGLGCRQPSSRGAGGPRHRSPAPHARPGTPSRPLPPRPSTPARGATLTADERGDGEITPARAPPRSINQPPVAAAGTTAQPCGRGGPILRAVAYGEGDPERGYQRRVANAMNFPFRSADVLRCEGVAQLVNELAGGSYYALFPQNPAGYTAHYLLDELAKMARLAEGGFGTMERRAREAEKRAEDAEAQLAELRNRFDVVQQDLDYAEEELRAERRRTRMPSRRDDRGYDAEGERHPKSRRDEGYWPGAGGGVFRSHDLAREAPTRTTPDGRGGRSARTSGDPYAGWPELTGYGYGSGARRATPGGAPHGEGASAVTSDAHAPVDNQYGRHDTVGAPGHRSLLPRSDPYRH